MPSTNLASWPRDDGVLHLPALEPELARQVRRCRADLVAGLEEAGSLPGAPHPQWFEMIAEVLEPWFARRSAPAPPVVLALLVHLLPSPLLPETVALQVAFGTAAPRMQGQRLAALTAAATERGLSLDDHIARLAAEGAVPDGTIVRLFGGREPREPDHGRIRRGIGLLRRVAALSPPTERPHVLCAIGWLHWARGQHPYATTYLLEALRLDPEHILANGLLHRISVHPRPVWLTQRPR